MVILFLSLLSFYSNSISNDIIKSTSVAERQKKKKHYYVLELTNVTFRILIRRVCLARLFQIGTSSWRALKKKHAFSCSFYGIEHEKLTLVGDLYSFFVWYKATAIRELLTINLATRKHISDINSKIIHRQWHRFLQCQAKGNSNCVPSVSWTHYPSISVSDTGLLTITLLQTYLRL